MVVLQGHFNESKLGYLRIEFDGVGVTETHLIVIFCGILRLFYFDIFDIKLIKTFTLGNLVIFIGILTVLNIAYIGYKSIKDKPRDF